MPSTLITGVHLYRLTSQHQQTVWAATYSLYDIIDVKTGSEPNNVTPPKNDVILNSFQDLRQPATHQTFHMPLRLAGQYHDVETNIWSSLFCRQSALCQRLRFIGIGGC